MSEYLGTKDYASKPASWDSQTRKSTFDRDIMPGGPMTASYENYIRSIFRPGNKLPSAETVPISASTMLRMQEHLGSSALDDSLDNILLKSPLESAYSELGLTGLEDKTYRNYPIYMPKQSNEYFSLKHGTKPYIDNPLDYQGVYSSYRQRSDDEWKRNNKQMIIDYKEFDSSPLSPYMYQEHPYVQRQDSRIVGSNFVQITSRPRDRFLDKIDRTLAEVRSMPRYC
uniref:Zasp-like motif domain-containing protein n=1 Tax=Ascaris lumbricoides TaxID=6252 RepID=A0A9J2PWU4_ASCLU